MQAMKYKRVLKDVTELAIIILCGLLAAFIIVGGGIVIAVELEPYVDAGRIWASGL